MKSGDFVLYIPSAGTLLLCLCTSIDAQNGGMRLRQITDYKTNILDEFFPPVTWTANLYDPVYSKIKMTDHYFVNIMNGRPLPNWVIAAQTSLVRPGAMPVAKPTYPIGSLFIGTSKAGNVWIVNKQNSDEISMLWDGNGARFCGSELERADRLKPNLNRQPDNVSGVIDHINKNFKQKFFINQLPQWALNLLYTQANAAPVHKPVKTGMSPAVTDAMLKSNILTTKPQAAPEKELKKLDSFRETCNHTFKTYIGFSEIYDYCTTCDFKIRAKQ